MFLSKINYRFYSSGNQSSVQRQPLSVYSVLNSWQITEVAQWQQVVHAPVSFSFPVAHADPDLAESHVLSAMCFSKPLGVAFPTHFPQ